MVPSTGGHCKRLFAGSLSFFQEVTPIEVKINKEVRDYQESLFFGLSLRQTAFALLAVTAYFLLRGTVDDETISVVCILAAFPFALCGFFRYNGMTFERFILVFLRSELLYPKRLVYRSENLYAKVMEHSSVKEALKRD